MRLGLAAGAALVTRERDDDVAQPAAAAASAARNSRRRTGMPRKHRTARKVLDRSPATPTSSPREGTHDEAVGVGARWVVRRGVWSRDTDRQCAQRLGDADGLCQRDRSARDKSERARAPGARPLALRNERGAAAGAAGPVASVGAAGDQSGAAGGGAAAARGAAAAGDGARRDADSTLAARAFDDDELGAAILRPAGLVVLVAQRAGFTVAV